MRRAVKLLTALTLDYLSFSSLCTSASMWQSVKGRFISVIGANISCACAKSPEGLSPSAHLADGCMDLILVKHTSRFQYLKHMLRITSKADQVSTNHFFYKGEILEKRKRSVVQKCHIRHSRYEKGTGARFSKGMPAKLNSTRLRRQAGGKD